MKLNRIRALLVCLVILTNIIAGYTAPVKTVYAYESKAAYVHSDVRVNVRSDAGTVYPILTSAQGEKVKLYDGHEVTIIGEKEASDGSLWYNVQFKYTDGSTLTGYMHSDYLIIDEINYKPDADFEAYLDKQGFPVSYRNDLRKLHEKYPNWVFVADKLDVDWITAVINQGKLGRNLISINAISSWKSIADGSFDWIKNEWATFDGGVWASASKGLIEYCMDPRNFLDEQYIFQFELLSYQTKYQNIEGVKNIIVGTFMENATIENDMSYAKAIMEAAEISKVSPYHLAASIIQEQGKDGKGNSISGTVKGYEGFYNYFNWNAYAGGGNLASVNGLIYAKGNNEQSLRPWNTRYKSIVGGSVLLGLNYIGVGQDTLYYKKFDYVGTPYTHQYMTHILAPSNEALIVSKAYTEELKNSNTIVFKIPVFKNMPENKVSCPETNGNPNAYLEKLEITGYEMTPSFAYDVHEYTIVVPYDVDSIEVVSEAIDKNATIIGNSKHEIVTGPNSIIIKVTAENGEVREYKITVIREEIPKELIKEIEITSDKYMLDTENLIVSGLMKETSVKNFLKGFKANKEGTFTVINDNGDIYDGNVGTGLILRFTDKLGATKDYTILMVGDINGDGKRSIIDAIALQKHILGINKLEGLYAKAGDVNEKNDGITIVDAIMLQKLILSINE